MKFYVVSSERDGVAGCERSLRAAHKLGRGLFGAGNYLVQLVVIGVKPSEAVRLLLGNLGGYATETAQVYPTPAD